MARFGLVLYCILLCLIGPHWRGDAEISAAWLRLAWPGPARPCSAWTGLGCDGTAGIESEWIGLEWIGFDWIGLLVGMGYWIRQFWFGLVRLGLA